MREQPLETSPSCWTGKGIADVTFARLKGQCREIGKKSNGTVVEETVTIVEVQ